MRYAFPAVFTPEDNGQFSIYFPDLEGCYTCGDSMQDGILMAQDILAYTLYDEYEKKSIPVPVPSTIADIRLSGGEFINFIACDTIAYAMRHSNRAVKKTLTIPEWLDFAASERGLNFSQVLQEALKKKVFADDVR